MRVSGRPSKSPPRRVPLWYGDWGFTESRNTVEPSGRLATESLVELSAAAARDVEDILDQSIVDYGVPQTERYFESPPS